VTRERVSSGGPWEERIGYSRAIRAGDRIWVSGTTGTRNDGSVPSGAGAQTVLALDTIIAALEELGAGAEDVVVVRSYVVDIERDWEEVSAALGAHFADVRPAMAMVEVRRLMLSEHLIEIEVEAVVGG
jgi:enamine deaminase RidA (YjgF/YER057c/UK114 family)